MSRLLINEHPLQVLPTLATKIGLNEAIVLQQIHYWNDINKKANNNFRDGYYWTFNSYEGWAKQFPFWSSRTIQRAIKKLEDYKLVAVGNYNKLKIDRTKWYRIDYKVLEELENQPFGQSGTINMTDWLDHLDRVELPLPETNSETSSKTNNLHFLETTENGYISEYLKILKRYRPKHKRVSEDNLEFILDTIEKLESEDISLNEWISVVEDYFDNLTYNNDGDILAFLKGTKRHFDIDL